MPKYEVEIRYTGTLTLIYEAKDADEAERKAAAKFQDYKLKGKLNAHVECT